MVGGVLARTDLLDGEAPPFELINGDGTSEILLICEHAGRRIPRAFDRLGLAVEHQTSHIAWDIGAKGLAVQLSQKLDAALAMQRYSRLIYDCNRDWGAIDETPVNVDFIDVPGNRDLGETQRRRRRDVFYEPFFEGTRGLIDGRLDRGRPTVIVTIHSFTPVFKGKHRDLDIGVVHDSDARLADIMCAEHGPMSGLDIQRNEPYGPDRGVTHTLKVHGCARGLLNVMIEVRNDLIADEAGQTDFAGKMAEWIGRSIDRAVERNGSVQATAAVRSTA